MVIIDEFLKLVSLSNIKSVLRIIIQSDVQLLKETVPFLFAASQFSNELNEHILVPSPAFEKLIQYIYRDLSFVEVHFVVITQFTRFVVLVCEITVEVEKFAILSVVSWLLEITIVRRNSHNYSRSVDLKFWVISFQGLKQLNSSQDHIFGLFRYS